MIPSKLCAALFLLPGLALSAQWNCRNQNLEVICSPEKCAASTSFTPMDVSISHLGFVTICAYSGCWEGKGKMLKSGAHLIISANKLRWGGASPNPASFIIALDKVDNVAVIKGANFAMPLICTPRGQASGDGL
mgnify:CR=1 FL=1